MNIRLPKQKMKKSAHIAAMPAFAGNSYSSNRSGRKALVRS